MMHTDHRPHADRRRGTAADPLVKAGLDAPRICGRVGDLASQRIAQARRPLFALWGRAVPGRIATLCATLAVLWLLGRCQAVQAQALVPADKQAVILTRALAYDKDLRARAGGSLVIAVLYRPGAAEGDSVAADVFRAFKALEGVKVQDLPISVVKLPYTGKDALKSAITAQGIDALYCCPGLEPDLSALREVSHQQHVLTLAAKEAFVQAGLSLGVFPKDGKPTIVINLAASRDEGASLASELLRLATVLR